MFQIFILVPVWDWVLLFILLLFLIIFNLLLLLLLLLFYYFLFLKFLLPFSLILLNENLINKKKNKNKGMKWSGKGEMILVGSIGESIQVFDRSLNLIKKLEIGSNWGVFGLDLSSNSLLLSSFIKSSFFYFNYFIFIFICIKLIF